MIHLGHTVDILIGGTYTGNSSWNKSHSDIDNCFKIYFITEGELLLQDNDRDYALQAGNLYFINGIRLQRQQCKTLFSVHWLHFIPKDVFLHHGMLGLPLVVNVSDLLPEARNSLCSIEQFMSGQYSSSVGYYLESLSLQTNIQSVIVYLMRRFTWPVTDDREAMRMIEPAVAYVRSHFCEPITIKQLADYCNMSVSYFHRLFYKTLQTTPTVYTTLLRMNAAIPLLLDDSLSIKEIAYRLGFHDDAYFSRVFKLHYGLPPGTYRKNRQKLLF